MDDFKKLLKKRKKKKKKKKINVRVAALADSSVVVVVQLVVRTEAVPVLYLDAGKINSLMRKKYSGRSRKPRPIVEKRATLDDVWQAQIGLRYTF